jgi:hypothetical protein
MTKRLLGNKKIEVKILKIRPLNVGKFGLIHSFWKREIAGSNPAIQTKVNGELV